MSVSTLRVSVNFATKNPLVLLSVFVIFLYVFVVIRPGWFATHDPLKVNLLERLQAPSKKHLFGTDEMGRDIFSRVVHGAQISVKLAAIVIGFSLAIGFLLGSLSGYLGGKVDHVIMRFTDMVMAFPFLILAMGISAALGPGIFNATIAISLVWWTHYVRLIRATILSVKNYVYVEASFALGARTMRLLRKHIWPECISPIVVRSTMDIGLVTISAASLSFIGLGAQPPMPEWGAMLSNARAYILDCWWYTTFPGLAIFLMVFSFNILGDELREILDPRQT